MILSVVVALPAAADFAAVSRILAASALSPNAETTWYIPSVRSAVKTPVRLETSRISDPISAVLAAISASVPVSRVETLASCVSYSAAAFTAAVPNVATAVAAAIAAPATIFPAFLAVVPKAARFLSASVQAFFRLLSVLPAIFTISS